MKNKLAEIVESIFMLVIVSLLVFALVNFFEAKADTQHEQVASDLICKDYARVSTPDLNRCLKCVQLAGFWNFGTEPIHNTVFFVHGIPIDKKLHKMAVNQSIPAMLEQCTATLEKDFNALGGNPPGYH